MNMDDILEYQKMRQSVQGIPVQKKTEVQNLPPPPPPPQTDYNQIKKIVEQNEEIKKHWPQITKIIHDYKTQQIEEKMNAHKRDSDIILRKTKMEEMKKLDQETLSLAL